MVNGIPRADHYRDPSLLAALQLFHQRRPAALQRHTLICKGITSLLFEVTMEGEVVWEYVIPYYGEHRVHGTVNPVFRARRYSPDFPGLVGKDLTPEG